MLTSSQQDLDHDPGQVDQVIVNLAVNARDAMPQGGRLAIESANVTVMARRQNDLEAPPDDYVRLAVTDTGYGISAYTGSTMLHHGIAETSLSFLQKPFTTAALAQKVREVIDAGRVTRHAAG